jgi:DNA polymerase III delta prime subunit
VQQHRQINAADARRQDKDVYLILRDSDKEADVVFLTNEIIQILNLHLHGSHKATFQSLPLNLTLRHLKALKIKLLRIFK